ncbi:MAG: hypothetical protein HC880_17675 [Bacteroidia bacterium]|nr:hypothetical protein [Bacteroidia bacterium]
MKLYRFLILFVLIGASPVVLAQGQPSPSLQELIKALQDYNHTYILPIMRTQRQKFNRQLSRMDSASLATLQTAYAKVKQQKNTVFKEYAGQGEELMQAWNELQHLEGEIVAEGWAVADKYESSLHLLLEKEIAAYIKLWREDMNALIEKYNLRQNVTQTPYTPQFKKYGLGEYLEPVGFVLWKIEEDKPDRREAAAEAGPPSLERLADPIHQIQLSVKEAGIVTVTLLNQQGRALQTIFQDFLDAGQHKLPVPNFSMAKNARYYQ